MSAFAIETGLVLGIYLLLYAAFSSQGARAFLERYLPQPMLRCPHCHEEVLQRSEAAKYARGMSARFESREDRCFLCPRCKKWSYFTGYFEGLLLLLLLPVALARGMIPALWVRILIYLPCVVGLSFWASRVGDLNESAVPFSERDDTNP